MITPLLNDCAMQNVRKYAGFLLLFRYGQVNREPRTKDCGNTGVQRSRPGTGFPRRSPEAISSRRYRTGRRTHARDDRPPLGWQFFAPAEDLRCKPGPRRCRATFTIALSRSLAPPTTSCDVLRTPAPKPRTVRFPAFFCTLRFGPNFLPVLGFEVRARCEWLRGAAVKRRRGFTRGSPRTTSCAKNIGRKTHGHRHLHRSLS
jgi:hypothetical protein